MVSRNEAFRATLLVAGLVIASLLALTACSSHETKRYAGKVVSERGEPIKNVSIKLCYLGWDWDWSMQGGFPLVMGQSFCSDPVLTDDRGRYTVFFAGPPSTFVLANHKDWVQARSFLADADSVVLIRRDLYQQRIQRQEQEKEKRFRKKKPGETETEYYCRVIQSRSDKVDLRYRGARITVTQSLLASRGKLMFGVAGPYGIVQALAGDAALLERSSDGRTRLLIGNFEALPQQTGCGDGIYFISSSAGAVPALIAAASTLLIKVESIRAVFGTSVWGQESIPLT